MKIDRLHQIRSIEKPAAVRSKTRIGVPRRGYRLLGTYSRTFIAASLAKDVLLERIREWVCLVPSALTDALSASAEAAQTVRPHAANLPTLSLLEAAPFPFQEEGLGMGLLASCRESPTAEGFCSTHFQIDNIRGSQRSQQSQRLQQSQQSQRSRANQKHLTK